MESGKVMVFPREPELISMERLLTRRIEKLFDAMDDGNNNLFDEITDEIEMLIKLVPPIYNELMEEKQKLIEDMKQAVASMAEVSNLARDDIYRQRFLVGETNGIEWDFRKDYMQVIFDIMGKYQLIPFETPIIGQMEMIEPEEEDMEGSVEVHEENEDLNEEVDQESQVFEEVPQQDIPPRKENTKGRLRDRLAKNRKKTKFEV